MRVKLKINFTSGQSDSSFALTEGPPQPVGTNMSRIDYLFQPDNVTPEATGYKGFQLSGDYEQTISNLDGSYKLYDKVRRYPGFISRNISDGNGSFPGGMVLYIDASGDLPPTMFMGFDLDSGEYCPWVRIDNQELGLSVEYKNNTSPVIAIPLQELAGDVAADYIPLVVTFFGWSKPYSSCKVTMISGAYDATFGSSLLKQLRWSHNSRDSQIKVSPQIITQYMDGVIYDKYDMLHQLAKRDQLLKNTSAQIDIIDDETGETVSDGSYYITEWNVAGNSSEVGIIGSDVSVDFDNISVAPIPIAPRTADDLLRIAFNYANAPWKYDDGTTRSYCTNCHIPDSWHSECTLSALFQDICNLCVLNIYWDTDQFVVRRCY